MCNKIIKFISGVFNRKRLRELTACGATLCITRSHWSGPNIVFLLEALGRSQSLQTSVSILATINFEMSYADSVTSIRCFVTLCGPERTPDEAQNLWARIYR